jgi:hypothetical protein
VPSNGFLVKEVKAVAPRFDAAPVVEATPEQVLELVQAPAQEPTAQQTVSEALVAGTPSDTAAPAVDWSQFDAPAWQRLGRASPLRSTLQLLNLSAFLRRQAD